MDRVVVHDAQCSQGEPVVAWLALENEVVGLRSQGCHRPDLLLHHLEGCAAPDTQGDEVGIHSNWFHHEGNDLKRKVMRVYLVGAYLFVHGNLL